MQKGITRNILNTMYSTTYTANYEHIRRAPAKRVFVETSSLVSPIIKKLLLLAVIVNVVLVGVIYIALFMFPQAKYSVTNLTHQEVSVGVETQSFIKELRTGTLKAVPAAIVTRAPQRSLSFLKKMFTYMPKINFLFSIWATINL